ncbi:MAG: zinc ribbon domain-containing protein [Pseudomonadota bacterium]
MPIYEYQCTACGHHFDTIQSFKDEALLHCPVCGEASLQKLISASAFHLKGNGWYVTDFKNQAKLSPENPESKETEPKEKEKSKKEAKEVKKEAGESKDTKPATTLETTKKADKSD